MELTNISADDLRRELHAFESAWHEATELGPIDRRAAELVWHSGTAFSRVTHADYKALEEELAALRARVGDGK